MKTPTLPHKQCPEYAECCMLQGGIKHSKFTRGRQTNLLRHLSETYKSLTNSGLFAALIYISLSIHGAQPAAKEMLGSTQGCPMPPNPKSNAHATSPSPNCDAHATPPSPKSHTQPQYLNSTFLLHPISQTTAPTPCSDAPCQ